MKFKTKDEWQQYLLEQLKEVRGGYAAVKYENRTELIYFVKHTFNGEPWVLESPNVLRRFSIDDGEYKKIFEDQGYIIKDGYAYDIDSPQTSPFLPDEIEIIQWIGSNEDNALEYLLNNDYKDAK